MRIFQLTDLHIAPENEKPGDVDVRANFLQIVRRIPKFSPDLIVISGDLSYREGNKKIYRWIRDQLAGSGIPIYVVAGNHDDSTLLTSVFHPDKPVSSDNKLYYFVKKQEELILFLDTGNGAIGFEQMEWIGDIVGRYQPKRLFLFMHHPPFLAGVPHMDNSYALSDRESFGRWCFSIGIPIYVFTGHYHVAKNLHHRNVFVQVCPASFFQIDETHQEFELEHALPGFTVIDVFPNAVHTQLHFCF